MLIVSSIIYDSYVHCSQKVVQTRLKKRRVKDLERDEVENLEVGEIDTDDKDSMWVSVSSSCTVEGAVYFSIVSDVVIIIIC